MLSRSPSKRLANKVVVFGLLLSSSAFAEPTAKQRAEARYREGLELAKAGKSEAALAKFEEANALSPSALAIFQEARMEETLGHARSALILYRSSLREEGLPVAERSLALKAVEELKKKVGVISIESSPGVAITVDGIAVDDPKMPVEVTPGAHIVKGTLGGETRVVDTELEAGKVVVVKISFEQASETPKPPPGTVTPPPPTETRDHDSYWTPLHAVGVGLAGLAAVGLGFTIGFVVSHENNVSAQEDVARQCVQPGSQACRSFDDHGESADGAKTGAIVSAIGTGVAATGAAILLLWPRSRSAGATTGRLIPGLGSLLFVQPF